MENDRIDAKQLILAVLLLSSCGGAVTVPASPTRTGQEAQAGAAMTAPPWDGLPLPSASPITLDSVAIADDVTLLVTSPVAQGERVVASVRTVRGADCTIVVTYSSGISTARGLEARSADGAGNVTWSWIIEADAPLGSWPVEVTCGTVSGLRAVGRQVLTVR